MIGIYKITNLINDKIYIGQAKNIERRWKEHINASKKENSLLYRAMRKYGLENFSFEVIEECSIEELNNLEIYYIWYYNSYIYKEGSKGYNMTIGGDCGNRGYKFSKESKHKLRLAHLGKVLSEEQRKSISERTKGGNHPMAKRVICEDNIFECAKDCAEHYGIPKTSLRNWLNKSRPIPQEWYNKGLRYEEESMEDYMVKPQKREMKSLRKKVLCEDKEFESVKECAKYYNLVYSTLANWLNGSNPTPQEWIEKGLKYKD